LDLGGRPHLASPQRNDPSAGSSPADALAPAPQRSPNAPGAEQASASLWQAEFYLPATEAEELSANGCSFHLDETFFERLAAARRAEAARSLTRDELERIVKSGRFPSRERDDPGAKGQ